MRLLSRVLLLCLLVAPGAAVADEFPQLTTSYSADQLIETSEGNIEGRVYFEEGGKQRTEMQLQGMQQVSIVRPDQQRVLMVMPQMNMVMELPFQNEFTARVPEYRVRDFPAEAVGQETLGGETTTKYRVTDSNGSVGHAWVTDDGIFMRMEGGDSQDQVVVRRSNVQRGPLDASLFEPPAGMPVTKMDPAILEQIIRGMQNQ